MKDRTWPLVATGRATIRTQETETLVYSRPAMLAPSKATLLAEIEPLTHEARVRRLVEVGRLAAGGDEDAAQTIRELHESTEGYERALALWSVFGSRDGELVLRSIADPSRTVRRRASRMVAAFCDDASALRGLGEIVEKRILCRTIAALARKNAGRSSMLS